MRSWINLTETFDYAPDWHWLSGHSGPGYKIATFTINDLKYFIWVNGVNNLSISFDQQGEQGITNTGNANKVFATVLNILIPYLNDRKPDSFAFAARKNQPSRVKLYRTMVRILASRLPGYETDEEEDHSDIRFTFTKNLIDTRNALQYK